MLGVISRPPDCELTRVIELRAFINNIDAKDKPHPNKEMFFIIMR